MPDISDLYQKNLTSQVLVNFITGTNVASQKEDNLRRIFTRLVDKAIYEYQMARQTILDQISEHARPIEQITNGRSLPILFFPNHLENCINAINRSLKIFETARQKPPFSTIQKSSKRSLIQCSKSITGLRNTFEHFEKRIQKDEITDTTYIMLMIDDDNKNIIIGTDKLSFTDLERTIRYMHEIGMHLYQPT